MCQLIQSGSTSDCPIPLSDRREQPFGSGDMRYLTIYREAGDSMEIWCQRIKTVYTINAN